MVDFDYKQRPTTKEYVDNFDDIFMKDRKDGHSNNINMDGSSRVVDRDVRVKKDDE